MSTWATTVDPCRNLGGTETFNLSAESEVQALTGRPRILNVDALKTDKIASFAREHDVADIIVTLIYHTKGPEGVQACVPDPSLSMDTYHSELILSRGFICNPLDEAICFRLRRDNGRIKIKLAKCTYDPDEDVSHKDCTASVAVIDFDIACNSNDWQLLSCMIGSVSFNDQKGQVIEAVCDVVAVLILGMIVCFRQVYDAISDKDKDPRTNRYEARHCLEIGDSDWLLSVTAPKPTPKPRGVKRTKVLREREVDIEADDTDMG